MTKNRTRVASLTIQTSHRVCSVCSVCGVPKAACPGAEGRVNCVFINCLLCTLHNTQHTTELSRIEGATHARAHQKEATKKKKNLLRPKTIMYAENLLRLDFESVLKVALCMLWTARCSS